MYNLKDPKMTLMTNTFERTNVNTHKFGYEIFLEQSLKNPWPAICVTLITNRQANPKQNLLAEVMTVIQAKDERQGWQSARQ